MFNLQRFLTTVIISLCLPTFASESVQLLTVETEDESEIEQIRRMVETSEFDDAVQLAAKEVQEIEFERGRFDLRLVEPLTLQGDGEFGRHNYLEALTLFNRAREVGRQNMGLHDLSQVGLLYREAEVYLKQDRLYLANARNEYAYSLYTREYGLESPELLPGLFKLADWYMATFNIFAARGLYKSAVDIGRATLTDDDPYVIKGLKGIIKSYRLEKFRPSLIPAMMRSFSPRPYGSINSKNHYYAEVNNFAPGETALLDVVKIYLASPSASHSDIAYAKLDLADWYLLFEKYEKAMVVYQDIWQTAESDGQSTFIEDEMSYPKTLYKPLPLKSIGSTRESEEAATALLEGKVVLHVTVTEFGKTKNIETISAEPKGRIEMDIRSSARKARYRPAFVHGKPTKTDDVAYVYSYTYPPD